MISPNEQGQRLGLGNGTEARVVVPISFQVRDFLREKNYVVGAATDGRVTYDTGNEPARSWGILTPVDRPQPRTFLGFSLSWGNPGRPFIGEIDLEVWLQYKDKFPDADWVLRVFGRQNIERMQRLASDMSEKFGKKIGVILGTEEQRVESRFGD